jgi:hypothetical protein
MHNGVHTNGNTVAIYPAYFLSMLVLVWFVATGSLWGQTSVPLSIKGAPPLVAMNAHGCPVLNLSGRQHAAVAAFLQAHPQLHMYDYVPKDYADGTCLDTYQQWVMTAQGEKAQVQYPFAVWGDFNHDGYLDFAVFFINEQPAVTHKWPMNGGFVNTYEYDWLIVVFQGAKDGTYLPVIAGKDRGANFIDGVIFHPGRKRIEYWAKSAGGSIQWTGAGYRLTHMKSND